MTSLVWHCVDSDLAFIADAQGTTLHFTHEGLTPEESACFEACSRGWTFYITKSLPQLITTGAGQPMPSYRR